MELLLYFSALLFVVLGVAHSYLGERFVLAPLQRMPELPKLFGSARFMRQILRLAWHVTSVAWFGLACIVAMLAHPPLDLQAVSAVIGITAFVSFLLVVILTRGRHKAAWVMFLVISAVTLYHAAGN